MQKSEELRQNIGLAILRSLLLQGSRSEEQEPISTREFYMGMSLVFGAIMAFGILIRLFGN